MEAEKKFNYVTEFQLCDRDHFLIVKGITVLVALIAHLCVDFWNIQALKSVEELAYAVFLVCSGFGVSESYFKKRGLAHYWENKIIKIWMPSLVVLVIFSVVAGRLPISWISTWHIGLKGYFLYVLFAGYIVFWLVARLIPKKSIRVMTLFGVALVLFVFLPTSVPLKTLYFAFPVGVMFSQFGWKRPIRGWGWGLKLLLVMSCMIVTVGTFIAASLLHIPYVSQLLWGICYIAVAATLCFGTYLLQVIPVFGVFVPLGLASYGLYLLYDEVIAFAVGKNDWRIIALIFAALFIAVFVFTQLHKLLVAWNKDVRRRKRTHIKGAM